MGALNPSKFFSWVLRVLFLTVPMLVLLAGITLMVTLPLTWLGGHDSLQPAHLLIGLVCGLIAWLFLSIFHFKNEILVLPFKDRNGFLKGLTGQLNELGYEVLQPTEDQIVSWPGFRSFLFGGRLQVRLQPDNAQISGPKLYVELLRKRLHQENQLTRLQQTRGEPVQRPSERLLKRVQISLRFPPELWGKVADEIVEVLHRRGAEVLCDLNLLVDSNHGVPELLIDGPLRDWLRLHALQFEIRKDLAQWEEPGWRNPVELHSGETPPFDGKAEGPSKFSSCETV